MTIILSVLIGLFVVPLLIGTVGLFVFSGRKKIKTVPTLLFHSVTENSSLEQSHITGTNLERFLTYLHSNDYTVLTVSGAVRESTSCDASKRVVMTFDDGFENFFTQALPLFEQYGYKASVFPVVKSLDGYSTWDTYAPQKQLSREQVRLLADGGHEIGSHTLTHPDLVLLSEREFMFELSESKKILEDITGRNISTISFPFGSWNMKVWYCAQKCGYTAAVAYRKHSQVILPIVPAIGVYAFDTVDDIIEKVEENLRFSNARVRTAILPHFAKGTPVWKFRKSYDIFNYFR